MQYKAAFLALFVAAAAAQDLSELPDCAVPCFEDNFPVSGCAETTDFACLCQSDEYNNAVTACVVASCSATDILASLEWAQETCAEAGVPLR